MRKLLVEAAWQGQRRSARMRARFEQFTGGDPQRRKIAVVATAHWLARLMHTMLRTGETWRPEEDAEAERTQPRGGRRADKARA